MRSIEMLLLEGFKVNILRMPTDEDPDEYVRAHGVEKFKSLFKTSQPYIEYIIDMAMGRHDLSRPSSKVEAINEILPHLGRMRDRVERLEYAAQIASRLKVDSRIIRDEMKRVAISRRQSLDAKRIRTAEDITQGERQLLELILANADVRRAIVPNLSEEIYGDLATGAIFSMIIEIDGEGLEPDLANLSERLEGEVERDLLPALLISDLEWAGGKDVDTLFKKATEALTSLKRRQLERSIDRIQIELSQAEQAQDIERVMQLYKEKAEIKKRKLALSVS